MLCCRLSKAREAHPSKLSSFSRLAERSQERRLVHSYLLFISRSAKWERVDGFAGGVCQFLNQEQGIDVQCVLFRAVPFFETPVS